jgi:site-specific DNA recombinase
MPKNAMRKVSVLYPSINNNVEKPKLRVAAYCRVSSSSDEQLSSCRAQAEYYESYIKSREEYILANIYIDEGISGTGIIKRNGYNFMINDCRSGLIDMIITKSVSRFGRNTLDCLNAVRELKALGIDVFFEKENIHSLRSEGELLLTLISAVAQNESLNLSENVKWGIRRRYEQGRIASMPCSKFLGYDKDKNGQFIINEAQAAIVKRIYSDFLSGFGFNQISEMLKSENIPTAIGGEWSHSAIYKILTNEKIKGDTNFQKTYIENHLTHKRIKNKGELPQYYHKDTHIGIIDKGTWECVQLEIKRQKEYALKHNTVRFHSHNKMFPLSGKITCGVCGNNYGLFKSNRKEDSSSKYWRCNSFHGNNGTAIEGKQFTEHNTPSRKPQTEKRAKRRKPPLIRQMICTDLQIGDNVPEQAFIKAWNTLKKIEVDDSANVLHQYRVQQLNQLLEEHGKITEAPYELVLKTLDYI